MPYNTFFASFHLPSLSSAWIRTSFSTRMRSASEKYRSQNIFYKYSCDMLCHSVHGPCHSQVIKCGLHSLQRYRNHVLPWLPVTWYFSDCFFKSNLRIGIQMAGRFVRNSISASDSHNALSCLIFRSPPESCSGSSSKFECNNRCGQHLTSCSQDKYPSAYWIFRFRLHQRWPLSHQP